MRIFRFGWRATCNPQCEHAVFQIGTDVFRLFTRGEQNNEVGIPLTSLRKRERNAKKEKEREEGTEGGRGKGRRYMSAYFGFSADGESS